MKIKLDSPVQEVRIEVVPLIDVIFCILTFFILAAMGLTRQQAISLDLPKANTGASQTREMLVVSIDPAGLTYVGKQMVSREELPQLLQNYTRARPNGLITLSASPVVSYNDVIQVLDLLRSAGGDRVALATQPADSSLLPQTPSSPSSPPAINPGSVNPTEPQIPVSPSPTPGGEQ